MDHALAIAALSERRCQTLRRRALFYFPGCFMRRTDGCHVRAMQTLDLLVAAGFDVVIYGYRQHPVWPWTASDEAACSQRFVGARLVLEEGEWAAQQMARVRAALSLLGSRARALALQLRVPGLSPALDKLKAEDRFDVVVVSYTAGITMLNGLPSAKVIVDAHDLPILERLRLRPGAPGLAALLRLAMEIGLLAAADGVWCIAFGEFWFLREILNKPGIRFVPPAVDPILPHYVGEPEFDLLFIGSDNRWNANALLSFLESFVGWSRRWRLAVAGNVGKNAQLRARADLVRNVELLGFQDDLPGLYQRSRAAICPVEGTGTKIKIVEALAAGRPVFAAPGAMRGLAPGYEGCVFPLKEEAVAAILDDQRALDGARAACSGYARVYSFEEVRRAVEADLLPATPQPA